MHDCFISYSRKDLPIAVAIQSILEQHGIRCWIDLRDAIPGNDYAGSIVRAIKNSRHFVLVLSACSAESPHVLNEINSAVNAGIPIIPFKVDDCALNDSLEYYLGKTQWFDASTPPLEKHILTLVSMLTSTESAPQAQSPIRTTPSAPRAVSKECRMVKYDELLSLGYTAASISLQLVENDYITCNGIGTENEGTAQQWEEYLQNNSETFQYLINNENQIVGDWSLVALNEESFNLAMQGKLLEVDIDISKTEMICFPGVYYGYILTFSLLPEYRNMKNYNLIIQSFLSQLEEYAENGIFFKSWCINVFGKEVESLIQQLGFTYVTNNFVLGKIYHIDFLPLPNIPIYQKRPLLVELYKNADI